MRHLYVLATFSALILFVGRSNAQGLSTESKGQEISAFGGFSFVQSDFGKNTDTGITAGAAFTVFSPKFHVNPSFVIRGSDVSSNVINERAVGAGLQLDHRFGKFTPYADFLFGGGSVVFNHPEPDGDHVDKGTIFTYGGGVDYNVFRTLSLRLDLQQQSMNFGPNAQFKPQGGDFTLSPVLFTIGVNYVVPFRPHTRYQDAK